MIPLCSLLTHNLLPSQSGVVPLSSIHCAPPRGDVASGRHSELLLSCSPQHTRTATACQDNASPSYEYNLFRIGLPISVRIPSGDSTESPSSSNMTLWNCSTRSLTLTRVRVKEFTRLTFFNAPKSPISATGSRLPVATVTLPVPGLTLVNGTRLVA